MADGIGYGTHASFMHVSRFLVATLVLSGGPTFANESLLAQYRTLTSNLEQCQSLVVALARAKRDADVAFEPNTGRDEGCMVAPQGIHTRVLQRAAQIAGFSLGAFSGLLLDEGTQRVDAAARKVCVSPLSRARDQYEALYQAGQDAVSQAQEPIDAFRAEWPELDRQVRQLRAAPKGTKEFEAARLAADRQLGLHYAYCKTRLIER